LAGITTQRQDHLLSGQPNLNQKVYSMTCDLEYFLSETGYNGVKTNMTNHMNQLTPHIKHVFEDDCVFDVRLEAVDGDDNSILFNMTCHGLNNLIDSRGGSLEFANWTNWCFMQLDYGHFQGVQELKKKPNAEDKKKALIELKTDHLTSFKHMGTTVEFNID